MAVEFQAGTHGPCPHGSPSLLLSRRAGSPSLGRHQFRSGVHLLEARREAGGNGHTSQASQCQGQEQSPEVIGKQPLCCGRSTHHAGEVRRETCPHRTLPGHSLGGRGHLLPPEATVRASVSLTWRGRQPVGVRPEAHVSVQVDDNRGSGRANEHVSPCGFPVNIQCRLVSRKENLFHTDGASRAPRRRLCLGWHSTATFCSLHWAGLVCEELEAPLVPRRPLQVRAPGRGALGFVCLLAAQWVWTRSPVGYLTNTGSQKGLWHTWHSCLSESRKELLFSFIWSCL